MDEDCFVATFGGVYENSPWIARQLWRQKNVPADVETLAGALAEIVDKSDEKKRLALIKAHPDLAGRAALAGTLTEESRHEQTSAGLDHCTSTELEQFQDFNERYKARFGFPFVMAVKGADRQRILAAFSARIGNEQETELNRAVREIHKIARLRLEEIARNA